VLVTDKKVYKLYDHGVIIPVTELSNAVDDINFRIISGSRVLFDLFVKSISLGGSITIEFYNNFTVDADILPDLVLTLDSTSIGHFKKIITDFQFYFNAKVTVVGIVEFGLAISVFDNSGTTVIENAEIDVHTTSKDVGTRPHDSMRIGDQNNELGVNYDGSINVNIVSTPSSNELEKNLFNLVPVIPSGIETSIISYTVPLLKTAKIQRVGFSGQSIGTFNLYKNDVLFDQKHTWFSGPLHGEFTFVGASEEGQTFNAGDKIELKVIHNRTSGDFSSRIQLIEIS
jgi:hypothetical protein